MPKADAPRTKPSTGALRRALTAPADAAHPTLAQRIADDLGVAIVDGALADGARIREEELARHYSASRSPVREAIALLERRGLVRTVPRRGTHVVGQSLDVIADLFNMRAVLVGLASRYVARRRDPAVIASLQAQVDALSAAVERPGVTPLAFARMGGDTAAVIVRQCGASYLVQMLSDHAHHSGWGMIGASARSTSRRSIGADATRSSSSNSSSASRKAPTPMPSGCCAR